MKKGDFYVVLYYGLETLVFKRDLSGLSEHLNQGGGTSFVRTGQNSVRVLNQSYHYNMRPYNSGVNIIRNALTIIGYPMRGTVALPGKSYMIHYANPTIKIR